MDDPIVAALRADPAQVARSPLTRWMLDNLPALREQLDRPGVDWTRVAALLARHGIVDQHGKPPTRKSVRLAWQRVRRAAPPAAPGISGETGSAPDAGPAATPPPSPAHPSLPPAPREPDPQDGVARPDGPSPGPVFQFGIRPKRKDI